MKRIPIALLSLAALLLGACQSSSPDPSAATAPSSGQSSGHASDHASHGPRPVELLEGLGGIHHPITTENAEAQAFFDQGLALLYGFNHDEAARSFRRASELDPEMTKQINWCGSVRLARLASQAGVSRYIFSSSCSVYGQGLSLHLTEDFQESARAFVEKRKPVFRGQ